MNPTIKPLQDIVTGEIAALKISIDPTLQSIDIDSRMLYSSIKEDWKHVLCRLKSLEDSYDKLDTIANKGKSNGAA